MSTGGRMLGSVSSDVIGSFPEDALPGHGTLER